MPTINQPIEGALVKRKEKLKKTWLEIIKRGIEAFENNKISDKKEPVKK